MPNIIKYDPTKDDARQMGSKVSRKVSEMVAPQLEDMLEKVANEKIWAHPQIKDNEIPSTSLAASVIYDIDTSGNVKLILTILNDEIDGTKDIEIKEYSRQQVTASFESKGDGKVSGHKRSLVNKRHFKLSDGSWITSSAVPAEILTEVVEETLKEVLGEGSS